MFAKRIQKLMACLCVATCATTMIAPAAPTQAATNTSTVESIDFNAPFENTSIGAFAEGDSYTLPVFSTTNEMSSSTALTISGEVTPEMNATYTITFPKDVCFSGQASTTVDQGSVYFEITDSTGKLLTNAYSSNDKDSFSGASYITAGTYTLTVQSNTLTGYGSFAVQMYGINASSSGTIKAGETYLGYNNKTTYKKFTVSSNRVVGITAFDSDGTETNTYGRYITICNSKKKAISQKVYTSSSDNYTALFGLKKGTYYVKISSIGTYCIGLTNSKKGTISATSKKKAKKITSSYKNYIIPASTSKSSAWFKYDMKKSAKKTLSICYNGNYSVKATIYKGSKAVYTYTIYNGKGLDFSYTNLARTKKVKWQTGTYYVKISKNQKTDSGLISIKIK